jgi:hypothetical protein
MNPTLKGQVFSVSISSLTGRSYSLQYTDRSSSTNWTSLPPVTGNGGTLLLTDPAATSSLRFYRVRQ